MSGTDLVTLPLSVMVFLYGLPLLGTIIGALAGFQIMGEGASILGAVIGLIISGMVIRATQSMFRQEDTQCNVACSKQ